MPQTKKASLQFRHTLKQNSVIRFPANSIRIADDKSIVGCDWRGALHLYFNMSPFHPLLSDGSNFYFRLPESSRPGACAKAIFLAMLHHLHNIMLLLDPKKTPSFQTPLQEKYTFIRNFILQEQGEFANLSREELDGILSELQMVIKFTAYANWSKFCEEFKDEWIAHEFDKTETDAHIKKIIRNSEELITFLSSPIETYVKFRPDVIEPSEQLALVCDLILRKLDCHEIFEQTGVKPTMPNWVQELEIILRSKSRGNV